MKTPTDFLAHPVSIHHAMDVLRAVEREGMHLQQETLLRVRELVLKDAQFRVLHGIGA